jgi:hypothetical protein
MHTAVRRRTQPLSLLRVLLQGGPCTGMPDDHHLSPGEDSLSNAVGSNTEACCFLLLLLKLAVSDGGDIFDNKPQVVTKPHHKSSCNSW